MSISPIWGHVLYVEDNPAEAHLLLLVLTQDPAPYELTVLEDDEKALQFIEAKPFRPDLIILDVNIPRIDGRTALAAFKGGARFEIYSNIGVRLARLQNGRMS